MKVCFLLGIQEEKVLHIEKKPVIYLKKDVYNIPKISLLLIFMSNAKRHSGSSPVNANQENCGLMKIKKEQLWICCYNIPSV